MVRPVLNYEWRDLFNYRTRDVYNYENRQVYRDREVFSYEDRDVFNYEDREVFNYEPLYETRKRPSVQSRPPDMVCPNGFDPVQGSDSCDRRTVTNSPANHDCPATHPTKAPVFMCQRIQLSDPTGCPSHALVEVNGGWFCRPANAAPFGPAGPIYLANDARHSYVSIESTKAEYDQWHPRFKGAGGEDVYDPTDLELYESTISNHGTGEIPDVDVRWNVTPEATLLANYVCDHPSTSNHCISAWIMIHPDAYDYAEGNFRMNDLLRNNLVCHELGHTVGFDDGGTSGTSCMTGGDNSKLDQWEIRAINLQY